MMADDLGTFDVAVQGGGLSGVVQAILHSGRGNKVVIVEERGSLLREITRSRQTYIEPDDAMLNSVFFRDLRDELIRCKGYRESQFEPCRTELAAERLARQYGISILYQAKLLPDRNGQTSGSHVVALKGKLGTLTAGLFAGVDDAPCSGLRHSIWTSTWLDAPADRITETSVQLDGLLLPVRIRPGFHANTAYVDIVYPHDSERTIPEELAFNSQLGEIVGALRSRILPLNHARLSHLCDEPYYIDAQPGKAGGLEGIWSRLNQKLAGLFRTY